MIFRKLLGHICPLCLSKSEHYLCLDCQNELPLNTKPCPVCALPLDSDDGTCPDCIKQPRAFTLSISPLLYVSPVKQLVQQLKTRQPLAVSRALSPLLVRELKRRYQGRDLPEAIIPVPLHWRKRFGRGFNQAHTLCEEINRQTGIPVLNAVKAKHQRRSQKQLTRKQRIQSQRQRFSCQIDLTGKHLAVVDDVVTSGATVSAMTRVLLNAGARRVDIWSLARTPKLDMPQ